jgi:ankyrin repeat protein
MPKNSSLSPSGHQLIDACKSGNNFAAVRKLLDDGVDVNWKNKEGDTALIWASVEGHAEVVKLLLDRGALTDLQRNGGATALMYASFFGHVECVRLLLERGADMSIKDRNGKTAKDDAIERGNDAIGQLLNEVCMLQNQDQ